MKTSENDKWLDNILIEAIGSEKRRPDFAKWRQEHPQAVQTLKSQAIRKPHPRRLLDLGRVIMRSPITKFAVAATIIVAVVISVSVFNKTVPTVIPTAFGIEQVIAASDNIRYLHVKKIWADRKEADEFWIKSDEQGHVEKARYYLPKTEDGVKLITWTPEGTELWFKSKRWLALIQTKRIEAWMQRILEQCQPKFVMQQLLKEKKKGKVDIDIQKPTEKQKPALIIARYKNEQKIKKSIYYIDQATDLITRIEHYRNEDDHELLDMTVEFSNYNIPIDEKMFSLKDEVPKDVRIADRLNQICGVPQGDMNDAQAAVETIRQYLQALIDKDYKKAGLICLGMLEEDAKKDFCWCNITSIVSIGPPIAQSKWREHGFKVPFEIEVVNPDGRTITCKARHYVSPGDDEMHPEQWNITSGGLEVLRMEPQILPDNEKYEKMEPKEMAIALGNACTREDWGEALKFVPLVDFPPRMKTRFGGLQIISIGEPFKSDKYPGWYIPYEIKLKDGSVEKGNMRIRNDNPAKRWIVDGGF
jgi:hypothetical protein